MKAPKRTTAAMAPVPAAPPAETANTDLNDLHDTLVALSSELAQQVGLAPDSATAQALVRELDEVNHRVTLVGNLLFAKQTTAITNAMNKVRAAQSDVDAAIKDINNLIALVKGVTAFLGLVDKVIDTAKLVGL